MILFKTLIFAQAGIILLLVGVNLRQSWVIAEQSAAIAAASLALQRGRQVTADAGDALALARREVAQAGAFVSACDDALRQQLGGR